MRGRNRRRAVRSRERVADRTWIRVDGKRAPKFDQVADQFAVTNNFGPTLTTVGRNGIDRYKGTLDFTKMQAKPSLLQRFPDGGKAVAFTAEIDAMGFPNTIAYTVPAGAGQPEAALVITYGDKGHKLDIRPPDGKVVDAPKDLYVLFGG